MSGNLISSFSGSHAELSQQGQQSKIVKATIKPELAEEGVEVHLLLRISSLNRETPVLNCLTHGIEICDNTFFSHDV
jgi:hypothetical protein